MDNLIEIKNIKLISKILEAINIKEFINIKMDIKYFYIHISKDKILKFSKKEIGNILGDSSVKRIILTRRDILSDTFESQDNKMGAGKLAAQVGHAIEAMNLKMLRNNVDYKNFVVPEADYNLTYRVRKNTAFSDYSEGSFTKIILTIKTKIKFLNFYQTLIDNNINSVLIQDDGRTVFNNQPTYTCIGIEPEYSYIIDCFTSRFQVLK